MGLGFKKKKAVKWHSFFKSGCKTCICQNSLKYIFFSIKGVESQSLNHTRSEHAEIDANTMILNYLIKTIFPFKFKPHIHIPVHVPSLLLLLLFYSRLGRSKDSYMNANQLPNPEDPIWGWHWDGLLLHEKKKSRCFWSKYGRNCFLLPPGPTAHPHLFTSLEGMCGHLTVRPAREHQHSDVNSARPDREKALRDNPHVPFPSCGNHGSHTLKKREPQDGRKLGLWLTSGRTPPWRNTHMEYTYLGNTIYCMKPLTCGRTNYSNHHHLKRVIPLSSLPFPTLIPSKGLSPRGIWIWTTLDSPASPGL